MKRLDGTSIVAGESITVPAYGTIAYDACAHDEAQQYGVVTVESATKNALKAVVTRYGANGDYRFVTPVR